MNVLSFEAAVILSLTLTKSLLLVPTSVASPVNGVKKCESYKYYYDHGTEHCEKCREICQHREILGTEQQCESNCPKYLKAMECNTQADKYYDDIIDTCSSCSELCDNHHVRQTTKECKEKCIDYFDKMTPQPVPSLHKQNSLKAVSGDSEEPESSTASLHPGWIASIAIGSIAIVCTILVAIILFRTCYTQYVLAPGEDDSVQNRRPVEETSQGSASSQHFAIDAGGSGLRTELQNGIVRTGFSDLRDDGNTGERV